MKDLRLSLKKQWFDVSSPEGKTEDYREINAYWCKRLLSHESCKLTVEEIVRFINNYKHYGYVDVSAIFTYHDLDFKSFDTNTMTLGYPKAGDHTKHKVFAHAGIDIRTGRPEWGAEPNKLYFVIKHGEQQK